MKMPEMTDEEFYRMYEAHMDEGEMKKDFLDVEKSLPVAMGRDLQKIIDHFIELRQSLKDSELKKLEAKTEILLKKIKEIHYERLFEEIKCFKDIKYLHKKLIEKNDQP